MRHWLVKCRVCEDVISQCRCPSPEKRVKESICGDCACKADNRPPLMDHVMVAPTGPYNDLIKCMETIIDDRMDGRYHEDDDGDDGVFILEECFKAFYGKTLKELFPSL